MEIGTIDTSGVHRLHESGGRKSGGPLFRRDGHPTRRPGLRDSQLLTDQPEAEVEDAAPARGKEFAPGWNRIRGLPPD
jgi:hypothetical protein